MTDPNPMFQSIIESARRVYAAMPSGGSKRIGTSLALLERDGGAVERVKAWAEKLGFSVEITHPEQGNRYSMPATVWITINKP